VPESSGRRSGDAVPPDSEPATSGSASGTTADTPATPRKRGAKKRPAVPRPRDRLFDAVAEVTGLDPRLAGSKIGRVCSALREGDPPYTPEEVRMLPDLLARRGFTLPLLPWSIPDYIGLVRKTHGVPVGNWLEMSAEELVVALKPLPNDQAKAVVESLPPDKQEAYFRARDSAWEAEPYVPG